MTIRIVRRRINRLDRPRRFRHHSGMKLELIRDGSVPLYMQIVQRITLLIEKGVLKPGTRLPTVRKMSQDQGLGRMTVQTAYAELQAQGWIESVVGRGTFVAERQQAQDLPQAISPRVEVPGSLAALLSQAPMARLVLGQAAPAEETFPLKNFRTCLGAALGKVAHLSYGSVVGEEALRAQISRLLVTRGLTVPLESVVISSGAQQAIELAIRTLTTPDQSVAVEAPVYPGVLEVLASRRQRILEVPVEEHGLSLEQLEKLMMRDRPALLYTVPTFQNPTGTVTSIEHRKALLRMAEKYDFYILEDDVYGHLAFDAPAPPCLKSLDKTGRVVYVTGFSKSLMPALRLGAVVATPGQLAAFSQRKQTADLVSSSLMQAALAEFLKRGFYQAHLQRVCKLYRERRDAACRTVSDVLPEVRFRVPQGGLSMWLQLPGESDEADLFLQARKRGLVVARGEPFFARPQPRGFLRLSFASVSQPKFRQAANMLAELLKEQRRRRREPATS
jgi:2-aminoadipate transaminase